MKPETTALLYELNGYVDSIMDANTKDKKITHIPFSVFVRVQEKVNKMVDIERSPVTR